jgi:hypothetical protein
MGMLKRMKDMKDMVNAAPGMVEQAQQLGAQAQQMAMAQQAAAQAQMAQAQMGQAQMGQAQMGQFGGLPAAQPGAAATGPDFDPVAGVSLEEFAAVSKGVAAYNYDQAKLPEIAAARGIPAFNWDEATKGWNGRIQANPAVAQRFNQLYRES